MGGFIYCRQPRSGPVNHLVWRTPVGTEEVLILALFLGWNIGFGRYRKIRKTNLGLKARRSWRSRSSWQDCSCGLWPEKGYLRGAPVLGSDGNLGLYGLFGVFIIVGISNGVNLTDGGRTRREHSLYRTRGLLSGLGRGSVLGGVAPLSPLVAGSIGAILSFWSTIGTPPGSSWVMSALWPWVLSSQG